MWTLLGFEINQNNGEQSNRNLLEYIGLGNIMMLCAAELYPDPKTSLGFTMCLERDYGAIADRNLVEDCALEHAVDINALNECATKDYGAYGMHLLRESVQRTSKV